MTTRATTVDEVHHIVREASYVRPRAGGTKSSASNDALDLSSLNGIIDYSPEECVFTARAATPVRDIAALLGSHGQYLPFDPPFADDGATIGGTVAAGVSGPGRYRYGGVRDFLIGIRLVDGDGRAIRSGGKVVKNAAGFLLHHGVVGSCGRFGILTEVTFKVFPAPEARRTIAVMCDGVEAAFRAARHVEQLRFDCESIDFDEQGELRVTVAGRGEAIEARTARLDAALLTFLTGTVPRSGGQSPSTGTVPGPTSIPGPTTIPGRTSTVKVAGVMKGWQKLRAHVTTAQFMCAGAVAWLTTTDVPALSAALHEVHLAGQVFRGPHAGERIGHVVHNEFEERVRRVLDPHNRFSAAPHSHH